MRLPTTYAEFKQWATTQPEAITAEAARRHFGCSHNTACTWLEQWRGQLRDAKCKPQTLTTMQRVFDMLSTSEEPMSVRQISAVIDLPVAAVTHAIANLYEANRVRRLGQSRPYTYAPATTAPDINLMPPPRDFNAPPLASFGASVDPTRPRIIAL